MDIHPEKQSIEKVFASTAYHIDFYQREYRWGKDTVERLLEDIFFQFNQAYAGKEMEAIEGGFIGKTYPWYYLNTYVTNKDADSGKVFVVDGQQRLTTLWLILVMLHHLGKKYESDSTITSWIDSKIGGHAGGKNNFWMNHEGHEKTQHSLYEDAEMFKTTSFDWHKATPFDWPYANCNKGTTSLYMFANSSLFIGKRLETELKTQHKFETFVHYFIQRIVLVDLRVEHGDVPMIFEVINDRGVRLKPYEILKGKLLGQINKTTLKDKKYDVLWETQVEHVGDENMDTFFRFYLRAKFADSRLQGQRFEGSYHRLMVSKQFKDKLHLLNDEQGVIKFLDRPFRYYTSLYHKIQQAAKQENTSAYYNAKFHKIEGGLHLTLSACRQDDPAEEEKIWQISTEVDRLYTLLQLQLVYESKRFQTVLYGISKEIREGTISDLRPAFDAALKAELNKKYSTENQTPFNERFFKQAGSWDLNISFMRYFFGRVERFIKQDDTYSLKPFLGGRGKKLFHVEHILAHNAENRALFDHDEDVFNRERNRLGALLLLKSKVNSAVGNKPYAERLTTYAGTLQWNQTLCEGTYENDPYLNNLNREHDLGLEPMNVFGKEQVEQRQQTLFKIAKIIWDA